MAVSEAKRGWRAVAMLAAVCAVARAQNPAPVAAASSQTPPAVTNSAQGGAIHGTVVAGTAGKPGGIPLPGVTVTATNSLTGKKFATATDINGAYAMAIPRNGRYVVRVELAAFAAGTLEVLLNAAGENGGKPDQAADFGLTLASRVAAAEARQTASTASNGRGLQSLSLNSGGDTDTADASAASQTGNQGAALPSLAGLGEGAGSDAVAVSGAVGQTNALGGISEDQIRERIEDAVAQGRANGSIPQGGDPAGAIISMIGGMMGGGGGPGGGGGGGRGGRGGGGGGGGFSFRNFNPAQPHGALFYQVGNSALNATSWLASAPGSPHFVSKPSAYSNNFGLTLAASPYIPGLTKPNTKQFLFINLTGRKNLTAFTPDAVRVPTTAERMGDFSNSSNKVGGSAVPVTLYDPVTGKPIPGNNLANASLPISPIAAKLLSYYPAPNITTTDPTANNYQTISNAGNNSIAINSRYTRQLGGASGSPFGAFGGGGGGGGGGGSRGSRRGTNANTPPVLRQSINLSYNYSHTAQDQRNIFLPLGGATAIDSNAVSAGYTISYGRLSNNASLTWNRSNSEVRNYFTDTANNPSQQAGLSVPNQSGGFADPAFYNGLATISISNFATISNQTPTQTINQTISFSDFVSYRHTKHNYRLGLDIRRVHADSIGGNNPLGTFTFTGFATAGTAGQASGQAGQTSGSAFADFLLGLPQSTALQAGLYKTYLRENVYDGYVQDDFRVLANVTLNYGLRYEYFAPFSEKNNRLVNLTGINGTGLGTVNCVTPAGLTYATPAGTVNCAAGPNTSLVHPDRNMFAPRFGFAYRPKFASKLTKEVVLRGGYGVNYNTGQYAQFARTLSHQQPFSRTQTNTIPTPLNPTATGCQTVTPSTPTIIPDKTITLADGFGTVASGFGCAATTQLLSNNYAVDPDYRLGLLQIYNLNLQRTLPLGIVMNLGYNGTHATNLDIVGSPNGTPSGTTTPNIAPFDYERSIGSLNSNSLVVSAQKRQQKGIALGATYTYSHTIANASGVGGIVGTPIQNYYRVDLEEGNAVGGVDQRHNLTGNFVLELPFGPNRAYLNKGGVMSKILDNYSLSGTFNFGSGHYFTPVYNGNQAEASSGNVFRLRPNRDFMRPTQGTGSVFQYFNTAAFSAPANGQYGTASQGSIEGPGTLAFNASLSRTVPLGDTRSFEARLTASNAFNTVQYSGINTTENSANFGQVTSAAAMRTIQLQARYRF